MTSEEEVNKLIEYGEWAIHPNNRMASYVAKQLRESKLRLSDATIAEIARIIIQKPED